MAEAEVTPVDISMLTDQQVGTYTRAFIDNKADYIWVDGWELRRHPWQREDLAQLEPLGYLVQDQKMSAARSDEQYTCVCYRPSPGFLKALRQRKEQHD
jgi:hypothetical protein